MRLSFLSCAVGFLFGAIAFTGCDKQVSSDEEVSLSTPTASTPPLKDVIGMIIQFGDGGGSERYRISGWVAPQKGLTFNWSDGKSARVSLPISANPGALTLKVRMGGLTNLPDLPFQPVEVYANGQKVADLEVGKLADFDVSIPAEVTATGERLELEFRIPKATSPKALGQSGDPRILGVFVVQMELAKVP